MIVLSDLMDDLEVGNRVMEEIERINNERKPNKYFPITPLMSPLLYSSTSAFSLVQAQMQQQAQMPLQAQMQQAFQPIESRLITNV